MVSLTNLPSHFGPVILTITQERYMEAYKQLVG